MPTHAFYDALPPSSFEALDSAGIRRLYERHSYLAHEGDASSALYIIESGLIRVERNTSSGRRVLLELSGRGDLFGDLGIIDNAPRSADALAIEPTSCLIIPRTELFHLFDAHPSVLLAITRSITARMRGLSDQLVQANEKETPARVAARIIELMDRSGRVQDPGPVDIQMPISQQELAQWAGLSREGTAKALRELRELGLLTTGRRRISVLKPQLLREVAARSQ